ncbi:MAG: hypothetical protein ABFR62_06515 [Bacteroidota bacterium]
MSSIDISKKWKVFYVLNKTASLFISNGLELERTFRFTLLTFFFALVPFAVFFGFTDFNNLHNHTNLELNSAFNTNNSAFFTFWLYVSYSIFIQVTIQIVAIGWFNRKDDDKNPFRETVLFVVRKLPALATLSLVEFIVGGSLLALYIGGKNIFNFDVIASILGIILFAIFFWFYIASSLSYFAVLSDDMSIIDSLIYSLRIVKNDWWSTFAYMALASIAILLFSKIISLPNTTYLNNLPLRDFNQPFDWTLELKRLLAFFIDLLAKLSYFFYHISIYLWYRYKKATYEFSTLLK